MSRGMPKLSECLEHCYQPPFPPRAIVTRIEAFTIVRFYSSRDPASLTVMCVCNVYNIADDVSCWRVPVRSCKEWR